MLRNKEAEQLGATSPTKPTFEVFFGRFLSGGIPKCPSVSHRERMMMPRFLGFGV